MTSYPANTAPRTFSPNSTEITGISKIIEKLSNEIQDLSLVVNGKKVTGAGNKIPVFLPHRKEDQYALVSLPNEIQIREALENSLKVRTEWAKTSTMERAAIFNKVADLIEFKYKDLLVAATMLGQSKTVFQGEIDAAAGLIDAIRFNSKFALDIEQMQPPESKVTNIVMDYRPLEGFVYAITPFNFTTTSAILSSAPALM